jgi:hypothetical protein
MNGKDLNLDMIQGAGGVSELNSGLSGYLDKYFTPSEKSIAEMQGLGLQFTALGVALPATKEGFRALVEGIDTTTPAGARLKGAILGLSGAFADGIDNATAYANSLAEAASAIVAQHLDLNIQLMEAMGDAAGAQAATRKRIIDALSDPESKAIQQRVFEAQDKKAAADKAAAAAQQQQQAAEQATQAAQQITAAYQSITDTIVGEVNRLRGLVAGTSSASLAQLQAKFGITTARAGDIEAEKLLPQMSQTLDKMYEASAGSLQELTRNRSLLANSLQETAAGNAKFGVKIPGFASGGDQPGGLHEVGETGPELEWTGPSRIFNANQTRSILSGGNNNNNDAVVAKLDVLIEELEGLRAEARATAGHTAKLGKTLDRVTIGGNYIQTKEVT